MLDDCPGCGLHFRRVPGQWLGSWFLSFLLTQAVVVGVLVLGVAATYPDRSVLWPAVGAGVAAVAVPLLFFPFSRTIWLAIDLAMRPLELDEGVAPGVELETDLARWREERDTLGGEGRPPAEDP